MLSNPNMSLMEFAQKVGPIHLMPHQRLLIAAIENGCDRIYCTPRLRLGEPRFRPTTDGRVKDTVTGYVDEPFSVRADEINRRP